RRDRLIEHLGSVGIEPHADWHEYKRPSSFNVSRPACNLEPLDPMGEQRTLATAGWRSYQKTWRRSCIVKPTVEAIKFPVTAGKRNYSRSFLGNKVFL